MRPRIARVDRIVHDLGHAFLADHRLHQAVRVDDVVEAEAALDAQPVLVGRAVAAGDVADLLVLDVVGDLAADAAIGADALDPAVDLGMADATFVDDRGGHQRAGRAGLDALAAGDAGAGTHRVVHVEHDLGVRVAKRHADHVVDLDLAAGAHAEIALDAGIEMDRHCRMAEVGRRQLPLGKAGHFDAHPIRPLPQPRLGMVRDLALRLVGEQQLHDHFSRGAGAVGGGDHLHAGCGLADAGRGEHALALDLDHAGAAVAVGPVAGLGQPAQMRDVDALARRDLPDGLARLGLDLPAVQGEGDRIGHDGSLNLSASSRRQTSRRSTHRLHSYS